MRANAVFVQNKIEKMYIICMAKAKIQENKKEKPAKASKPIKQTGLALEALLREALERLERMEARLKRIESKQDALTAPIDMLLLSRLTSLQNANSQTPPPTPVITL
jgi:hypothetical protein